MPRLGQHFLKNTAAMKKIVEALALKSDDTVIEIGPGHGELTSELRNKNQEARIIAIEKDDELCKSLEMKIGEGKMKNIEVIHGDALKILSSLIRKLSARDGSTFGGKSENFKLTGNIPYYITGKLLRLMSELKEKPERCVFMVQKEVAERIAATPPRMNRLAAMVQFWMIPETIMTLGKESFSPPPTVDSAVIGLKRKRISQKTWRAYERTAKLLFAQPRKTLLNNIVPKGDVRTKKLIAETLKKAGINPLDRPQNLSTEEIKNVAALLSVLRIPALH